MVMESVADCVLRAIMSAFVPLAFISFLVHVHCLQRQIFYADENRLLLEHFKKQRSINTLNERRVYD
jgi:hypothetical protein